MRLGRSLQNVCANDVQLILLSIVLEVPTLDDDEQLTAGIAKGAAPVDGNAELLRLRILS